MQKFKRVGRCVAGLLLLAMALSLPVNALAIQTPISNALIPSVPVVPMELPKTENQGHLVSLVRRSQYSGSAVIGCLEDGTRISVLKDAGGFYSIDCYDMKGYIAKSQVQVNESGEYVVKCDLESKESKYLPSYGSQEALNLKSQLRSVADDYLGVRYLYGGTSPRGFDCSGYTQYVMKQVGIILDRTAMDQLQNGVVIAEEDLQCGDLVFFSNTGGGGFCSHVAIYIGNGQIIHAGASTGIVISDLNSGYYREHFLCARRVILSDVAVAAAIPNTGILRSGSSFWRGGETGSLGLIR